MVIGSVAVMGGVNALTGGLAGAGVLSQTVQQTIQGLQAAAAGAFSGVRSIMSGDNVLGFLQILGGLASGAIPQMQGLIHRCATTMKRVLYQTVNSLRNVPVMIYKAVEAIENGDWFSAINGIINAVATLGQNFANAFNSPWEDFFGGLNSVRKGVEKWVNTGKAVYSAVKQGNFQGLLSGIDSVLRIWKGDLTKYVSSILNPPKYQIFQPGNYNQKHKILQRLDEDLYDRLENYPYDSGQKTSISVDGHNFEILDRINNEQTGLDAFLIRDLGSDEAIIVFRGTEVNKGGSEALKDVSSDIHYQGVGYNQLMNDQDKIEAWINENPGVTITGHSLGGAIAQFAAVQFPDNVGAVVTFNSPALSGHQLTSTDYEHFKANNPHIQTTHYFLENDMVSMAGNRFLPGDVYLLKQPDATILNAHALDYDGVGRVGHPDISFRKVSSDYVNDPEFAYPGWPQNTLGNPVLNTLMFPVMYTFGRDRQTAEFSRTLVGIVTGTGLVHSTP